MAPLLAAGTLEHFTIENPWPLAAALLLGALALGWRGLTAGERGPLRAAIACAVAATCVVVLGLVVTTPAERATAAVSALVASAEKGEPSRMLPMFAPSATMHYGSPESPGFDMSEIHDAIDTLGGRYKIVSNRITQLEGETVSSSEATVLLTCFTEVTQGYGATPNSWWFDVRKQSDGSWKVQRLALVKLAGQKVGPSVWR